MCMNVVSMKTKTDIIDLCFTIISEIVLWSLNNQSKKIFVFVYEHISTMVVFRSYLRKQIYQVSCQRIGNVKETVLSSYCLPLRILAFISSLLARFVSVFYPVSCYLLYITLYDPRDYIYILLTLSMSMVYSVFNL